MKKLCGLLSFIMKEEPIVQSAISAPKCSSKNSTLVKLMHSKSQSKLSALEGLTGPQAQLRRSDERLKPVHEILCEIVCPQARFAGMAS